MKHVVVTGASSGIGHAIASDLVQHGYRVFGSVRREEDASRIAASLGPAFEPLLLDVTQDEPVASAAARVEKAVGAAGLFGLVNNAGVAVPAPLMHVPLADVRHQFEVNLIGVLRVTQAFLPLLGARRDAPPRPGRIINISSVSGRLAYPFLGVYAASKFALEAVSDALRRELLPYGIDVIVIEPGRIQTPIWDKVPDRSAYLETDYRAALDALRDKLARTKDRLLPASAVSRVVRLALERKTPRTRYVLASDPFTHWLLPRGLPGRWLDRILTRGLGLK